MSGRGKRKQDSEDQENTQRSQSQSNQSKQRRGGSGRQSSKKESTDQQQDGRRRMEAGETVDPAGAARVGLLRLARNWRSTGNVYAAIYAYEQILSRYGGTAAASAASEELVGLAEDLEQQGMFYTALNVLNKVEALS